MKGFDLYLTLQEDCVFSETSATEGAHKSLDYIPGSALLGAVASRLYASQVDDTFTLFHFGKVRFGNAYPLAGNGQKTYPVALCWHQAKGETASENQCMNPQKIWRLDMLENGELPDRKQPQQLRAGYVAADGSEAYPKQSFRMKTAIDTTTGRAKEAALFGYESLLAGQAFHARITSDDDISDALLEKLKGVFSEPLLLGRSRSAEYGKVLAQLSELSPLEPGKSDSTKITLWLQSDLMILDEYGQSTLTPTPEQLGLPKGAFVQQESFLRTRRYSVWNAHKRSPEMERQVLSKGSVLVYTLERALTESEKNKVAAGLGVERAAGLGQVWLNPRLLETLQPVFIKTQDATQPKQDPPKPDSELIAWLENQQKRRGNGRDITQDAKRIAEKYQDLLNSSRTLRGLDKSVPVGPSHSQWGSLLAVAKSGTNLEQALFHQDGVCKRDAKGWSDSYWDKAGISRKNFHDWFKQQFDTRPEARFVQVLVREIMAELKRGDRV